MMTEKDNSLAIQTNENAITEWHVMREQAQMLVKTGFLPDSIKTAEQAVAIMLTGKELGIPSMQALRGINVIKGNPTLKPELMLALCIRRVAGFAFKWGVCNEKTATFMCQRAGMPEPYTSTFTIADAQRAGLLAKEGFAWKNYPGNMLRWRAVGNALHAVCPDVIVGIYTPEEMGAAVNAEGDLVGMPAEAENAEIVSEEPTPPKPAPPELRKEAISISKARFANDAEGCKELISQISENRTVQIKDLTETECMTLIDKLNALAQSDDPMEQDDPGGMTPEEIGAADAKVEASGDPFEGVPEHPQSPNADPKQTEPATEQGSLV